MGSQDALILSLKKLCAVNAEIERVICFERKSDHLVNEHPFRQSIERLGVSATFVQNSRELAPVWEELKSSSCDLFLSVYNRFIVPEDVLSSMKTAINFHPALLPKYRGPIPTYWALVEGEKECGVTAHYMTKEFDRGDVVFQEKFAIEPNETGFSLHQKAMRITAQLVFDVYDTLSANQKLPRSAQDESKATYTSAWNAEMRWIDWHESAAKIVRKVRALTRPYPGALTKISDRTVCVLDAMASSELVSESTSPGTIRQNADLIEVAAKDSWVKILEHKFESSGQLCETGSGKTS